MSNRNVINRILFYLVIIITVVIAIFPFYWMIVNSLQSAQGRFAYPINYFPDTWTFSSYKKIFANTGINRWLINSFIVSLSSSFFALVIGAWGAYAISRFKSRGVGLISYTILATQMMPPVVLMIPLYIIFRQAGLVDTILGLMVANFIFTLPVTVWMLKSIFDTIPVEIEEAAIIDGCSRMQVLARITGPLALPGFLAAGLFAFISSWDEFMFTRTIITKPDNWVGTIGIVSFIGEMSAPWDQINAAASLFTLVPVVLFLLVQKHFIIGISGGIKG